MSSAAQSISVAAYHKMIQSGALTEDDRVELLEGLLVTTVRKTPAHSHATRRLLVELEKLAPDQWHVWCHNAITTADSEPEPDISIVNGELRTFSRRHPDPKEVGLVIEIADATLDRDRTIKKRVYARANVPIYWIVNLVDRQIEVYTDPTGPADAADYRQRRDHGPADELPVVLDGAEIGRLAVRDLLP
jgi:Uma2 family endonuclease